MSRIITNNLRHNDATADNLTLDGTGNITAPGNLTTSGNLSVTGTSTLTNDLVVDTDTLFVDVSADRVGVGTPDPRRHFHIHETTAATVGLMLTNSTTGNADDGQGFQLKVGADGHAEVAQLENSDLRFFTNNTERLRILAAGGLTFGGDTAAANALDDYEEGTWTPSFSGGSGTPNSMCRSGQYVKVGRVVTVTLTSTSVCGGIGASFTQITALPFTAAGISGEIKMQQAPFIQRDNDNSTLTNPTVLAWAGVFQSTTTLQLGTTVTIPSNNKSYNLTITYITS